MVHFFTVLYKITTWNDQILHILENVNHDHQFNFNFFLEFNAVLQILFWENSESDRQTGWFVGFIFKIHFLIGAVLGVFVTYPIMHRD